MALSGVDIEIPLSGLQTVTGIVTALPDQHAVAKGTVRLLYADDREKTRETSLLDDGSFSLEYVPEGKYILQVSGAQDADPKGSEPAAADSDGATSKTNPAVHYTDKEIPLSVLDGMGDVTITVSPVAADKGTSP